MWPEGEETTPEMDRDRIAEKVAERLLNSGNRKRKQES
jgi:hypothetical protein